MAKVQYPLLSGDARGQIGKGLIFRRGGVVTKYFTPRNPNSPAQQAHRAQFRSYYMAGLTQAQADLLYSALSHLHDGIYAPYEHVHDHGTLTGLGDDDHLHYFNQARGDARYPLKANASLSLLGTHLLGATVPASTTYYTCPFKSVLNSTGNGFALPSQVELRNLTVGVGTQPASGNLEVTLYVDGVATSLKITIPAGGNGVYQDTSHIVVVPAGGAVRWDVKNNATGVSASFGAISMQMKI